MIYKTEEELTKEYSAMTKENLVSLLVAQDLGKIKNNQVLQGVDLSSSIFPDPRKTYIHEYIHDSRLLGCYGNSLVKGSIDADPSRVPMITDNRIYLKEHYSDLKVKEDDTIYFDMPSMCSGEYSAKVYKDSTGFYILKENHYTACLDYRINEPYWG